MKRTANERRIKMIKEKTTRAEEARKHKSQVRDNTRLSHRLITVNYGHKYAIEDGRASINGRRFFSHLNSKRNRRRSLLETKNQLLDKFFVDQEEQLRIEKLLKEYDDKNDEMSFESIIKTSRRNKN